MKTLSDGVDWGDIVGCLRRRNNMRISKENIKNMNDNEIFSYFQNKYWKSGFFNKDSLDKHTRENLINEVAKRYLKENGFDKPYRIEVIHMNKINEGIYNGFDSYTGEAIISVNKDRFNGKYNYSGYSIYNTIIHEATHALQSQISTGQIREEYEGQKDLLFAQGDIFNNRPLLYENNNGKHYLIENPSLYVHPRSTIHPKYSSINYLFYRLQPLERQAFNASLSIITEKIKELFKQCPSNELKKALSIVKNDDTMIYASKAINTFKIKNPIKAYDECLLYLNGNTRPLSQDSKKILDTLCTELFMCNMERIGKTLNDLEIKDKSLIEELEKDSPEHGLQEERNNEDIVPDMTPKKDKDAQIREDKLMESRTDENINDKEMEDLWENFLNYKDEKTDYEIRGEEKEGDEAETNIETQEDRLTVSRDEKTLNDEEIEWER